MTLHRGINDMPDKTEQILIHLEYIREKQDETNAHLGRLNGRVGVNETRLSVLESRVEDSRTAAAKWGGLVGGAIAAAAWVWATLKGGA
jgi:hypothetical protein